MSRRLFHIVGISLVSLLIGVAVPPLALADEQPEQPEQPAPGDHRVRTTETREQPDDERRPSAATTRVDTTDLSVHGEDLGDALMRAAGVNVRRESSFGQPAQITLRGGNPRQVAVELDGLRLSSPTGLGFDIGQLFADGFESADVIRGAGASYFGSGALSGAVRLNPRSATEGQEILATGLAGSQGTAAGSLAVGSGSRDQGLRLFGSYRRSDGAFPFIDEQGRSARRINNDHERRGLGGTAHLRRGPHRLRLTALHEAGEGGSPGPSSFQRAFAAARVDDDRGLVALRWDGKGLTDLLDASATLGAQVRGYTYENPSSFLTGLPFSQTSTERNVALTTGLVAYAGDHALRLDVDARLESYESDTEAVTRRILGASLGDEWHLLDDRLVLIGALRAEVIDELYRPFLPALGAVFDPGGMWALRANLARTFRAPHFDELYLNAEGIRGNPDLAPEEATVLDGALHLRGQLREGRSSELRLSLFHHWIDESILFLPVSAYLFEATNLSGVRARGVEAEAVVDLHLLGLFAAYTFTDATFRREAGGSGAQLPQQPRHRGLLEARVELPADVTARGGVHYRSALNLDNFGNLRTPGSLRVDLGIARAISPELVAAVQVRNLLDDRRAQDSLQRPLPGRTLFVSLQLR